MRRLSITLLSSLIILALSSCSEDTEVGLEPDDDITGSWSLVRLEGGLSGIVTEFQPGDVILDFSSDQVTITSDDNYDLGFSVGVYDYQIESTDSGNALLVGEGILNGTFELFITRFTIDQRAWDGPLYTFERNLN